MVNARAQRRLHVFHSDLARCFAVHRDILTGFEACNPYAAEQDSLPSKSSPWPVPADKLGYARLCGETDLLYREIGFPG